MKERGGRLVGEQSIEHIIAWAAANRLTKTTLRNDRFCVHVTVDTERDDPFLALNHRSLNHILKIVSAVGIATNSTQELGLIYLRALQASVPTYTPCAYLGDAAEASANAAVTTFPSIEIRLMCFVHVYKVSHSFV